VYAALTSRPSKPSPHTQSSAASLRPGELEPTWHVAHTLLPAASEKEPGAHGAHAVAPVAPLKSPAGHSVHTAPDALVSLKEPAAHGAQACAPPGSSYPATHAHAPCAALACGELDWSWQFAHAAGPGSSLNVPAAHAPHAPPSAPEYPALQRQSTASSLAAGAPEAAGHDTQVAFEVAAGSPECESAGQCAQSAGPAASLYVPAPHGVHCAPAPASPV